MKTRLLIVVGSLVLADAASAQQAMQSAVADPASVASFASQPAWTFGPVKPHLTDTFKRTVYGLAGGAAFMGLGIGMDKLNQQQCAGHIGCFEGNPIQTGISFAFLGVLFAGTGPQLHSKCTRSGRAILGIVGGTVGTAVAGAIVNQAMFSAHRGDPATFRVMGSGLLGMSLGTGIATSIC